MAKHIHSERHGASKHLETHHEVSHRRTFSPHEPEHEHFLFEGLEFPATQQELVSYVTDAELDEDSQNIVPSLPDRAYESADDVWRAMGEAERRFGLGARYHGGAGRDDIGKQATATEEGGRER